MASVTAAQTRLNGRATLNPTRTLTCRRPAGPLVVDVWEAQTPAAVPPILLIHGWGGTGSYWRETAAVLSATATVIVPDLPGTGRSQPVRAAQNMYDQVRALAELLEAQGISEVQVVGHSMGGAMALLLADAHPDWVERLVLTSLSFFLNEGQASFYRVMMHAMGLGMLFRPPWLGSLPGMAQMMGARYFHRLPNETILQQGLRDYLALHGGTAAACAANAADPTIPQAGARVRVPTLLIACRQDQVMPPQNVDHTARTIPGCQVRWIDECGHLPMVEQPDVYLAMLREFLRLG